jgi:hypothetical protein
MEARIQKKNTVTITLDLVILQVKDCCNQVSDLVNNKLAKFNL